MNTHELVERLTPTRRRAATRDRPGRRRARSRPAHPARGATGYREVDAVAVRRPRTRARVRVRRGQRRTHAGTPDRPFRSGPRADRRLRPRGVRRRSAGGCPANRFVAVRRGTQSGARGDAQRAGHGDERARTQRAAPRADRRRARVPPGGGDEPVRRDRNRPDLVGDLRPGLPAGGRLPEHRRRASIIVARQRAAVAPEWAAKAVDLVRRTRTHADLRVGSSVRGAIDMCAVAASLAEVRARPITDRDISLDAALVALSGRVRVREGSNRDAESIITDLWHEVFEPAEQPSSDPGKASAPTGATTDPLTPTAGRRGRRRPDHRRGPPTHRVPP